jgi:hypothetical protein
MNIASTGPELIEPGTKYFLSESLKQCKQVKDSWTNIYCNLAFILIFTGILALVLYNKYKGREQAEKESEKKNLEKELYLSRLLQKYQASKADNRVGITNLPPLELY